MADENISIEIADKVSPSISTKLNRIATEARSADAAVKNLQTQLAAINVGGLSQLINASANATRQLQAGAAAAQQRVATAATQSQTAAQNLAAATTRANTAQAQGQTAAQRLATEQARTATQTANAAAASDRAALAALRLQQAQDRAAQSSQRAASSIMSFVRGAAALVGVGLSAQAILQSADAYTALQNKISTVTDSEEQMAVATDKVFEVAKKTRMPIDETSKAFVRFDNALVSLGKSQEDSLRLTETVNKLLKIGASAPQEQASALLQLSQAFNSNVLAGEEFKAVSENMPKSVRTAIAEVLKINESGLKKAASEGKITGDVLFQAFKKLEPLADSKYAKLLPTLAEGMTNLKTAATQTFGEINKSLGITAGISKAIIFLSENMKALAVILAVVGAALLVAFGPALLGMLSTATAAVWTFTAALAANPIGALIVGITAATAAITLFGDQIAVTSDGAVSLKDIFRTVFAYIGDAVTFVTDLFKSAWETAFAWIKEATNGWGSQFASVGDMVVSIVKTVGNFYIATWVGAFNAIKVIWDKFPDVMQYVFASVVNFGATAVETIVNAWQIGLRKIAQLGAEVAPDMAGRLNAALDAATIKLPRMQVGDAAKGAAAEVGKAFKDAQKDYLGEWSSAFMKRAEGISAARRAAEGQGSALRGTGPNLTPNANAIDEKAAKGAEKRATALAKINAELDNELSRMYMLKPEREAQARFDQIEEQLLGKKIKLSQDEAAAIKEKIKAIQEAKDIQQAYDRIYEEAVGPQRDYNANLTAAQKLLSQGSITQQQYETATIKATEAYKNAIDPMRQYNKDLEDQFKLLELTPKAREIEQQMIQLENAAIAAGIQDREKYLAQKREELQLLQKRKGLQEARDALYNQYQQPREDFSNKVTAISEMQNSGDKASATNSMLQGMGIDTTNFQKNIDAQLAMYQTYNDQIKQMYDARLITEQEYASASMQIELQRQNVHLNAANSFFGNLAALQKSGNKKMAAVGKAAAIAQAMISTYQSATSAYAAMASIPYVGPALGAAAAAAAIAAGLANVQQIRSQNAGFKEGGYTGSIGVNEVAGVVHGREYVMDANATARIGVANLQALQAGAAGVQRNGEQAGAASVGNAPAAAPAPVVNTSFNAVVVQSKEAALAGLKSSEGQAFIIETIEQNGSTVAKIVGVK
jgi:tape measure domain-containing protein